MSRRGADKLEIVTMSLIKPVGKQVVLLRDDWVADLTGGFPHKGWFSGNLMWQSLLERIVIYEVGGRAKGLYDEWYFDVHPEEILKTWSFLGVDRDTGAFIQDNIEWLKNSVSSAYAVRTHSTPWGGIMGRLAHDRRSLKGLFVQLHGSRNQNPCSCCENRYLRTQVDKDSDLELKDELVHVMDPFFECISLPGYQNGACGNCLYHIEAVKCTFRYNMHPEVQGMKATRRSSGSLPDRRLSPNTCPRIRLRDPQHETAERQWLQERGVFDPTQLDIRTAREGVEEAASDVEMGDG